jgi:predicted ferric reductase
MTDLAMRPRTAPPPPPRSPRPGDEAGAPRVSRPGLLTPATLAMITAAFLTCVVVMWWVEGGVAGFGSGWAATATSVTRLTGLLASATGLVALGLIARPRELERAVGLDRIFNWHRQLGATTALLVGTHVVAALLAVSADLGPFAAVVQLTGREPYMAMATVGAALIGVVTISSLRSIRRSLSYEAWYFVHLTAYVGLALAFAHQIFIGTTFTNDAVARTFWIAANAALVLAIAWGRWGRLASAALHPLRVLDVTRQTDDVASIWLGGRGLDRISAAPGQFFLLRALRPRLWWHAHPFSLSAAPQPQGLRFTVKARGDATGELVRVPLGTRIIAEGPYGNLTPPLLSGQRVIFIVGGVGIAPALALIESLDTHADPIVLWRARSADDLVHEAELQAALARKGGHLATLVGPTSVLAVGDPFSADSLRSVAPDIAQRVAVVCGPERLLHAARRGLLAGGMPSENIHFERPWW